MMDGSEGQMARRRSLGLIAGAASATLMTRLCRAESEKPLLRIAVSNDTLAGANVNDARAAYLVWIDEYTRQTGKLLAEIVPGVFLPSDEVIRGIHQGTIDCFGITALEYVKLIDLIDPDVIVLQDYLADGIEYVLLVHNNSPFRKIADLRGAQVVSHLHRDMVLLPAWLGTLLAQNNLPSAQHFFGNIMTHDTVNQVVLPVFFHRMDGACLARRNWETAVELNPQLGRDLRVLAVSPKIIPIAVAFRRNCNAESRKVLLQTMLRISTTVAGQQMAALYQARGFVMRPVSTMKNTVEMVRQYERMPAIQASQRKGKS